MKIKILIWVNIGLGIIALILLYISLFIHNDIMSYIAIGLLIGYWLLKLMILELRVYELEKWKKENIENDNR